MIFIYKILILFAMFYMHIIDDYVLQGILANLKQKRWWKEHSSAELYKHDYTIALIEHAFSWSFSISIPLLITGLLLQNHLLIINCCYSYIYNTIIHAIVDNLKANEYKINLITDQCIHFIQIIATWLICMAV